MKINNRTTLVLQITAFAVFCFASYIAIAYARQELLDFHYFRQTQTALTSFWFIQDGFKLAYETPVAGYPWSIPFEFPIYQYLVAIISKMTGWNLASVGRMTSFIFLIGCLIPINTLCKQLALPRNTLTIFIALFLSSPIYLYWGRTFMIETAALFFSIAALPFFVNVLNHKKLKLSVCCFIIFSSLAMLQKSTTALPILAILGFVYLFSLRPFQNKFSDIFTLRNFFIGCFCFFIPLLVGIIWTIYTDQIKLSNAMGATRLTSSALNTWNWGTLNQRFSLALYKDVIWEQIFEKNLAGYLGLSIIIAYAFLIKHVSTTIKNIIFFSLVAGFLPLFIFTNLHIVHDYYQTANMIFILFGIAVLIANFSNHSFPLQHISLSIVLIMVFANLWGFNKYYFDTVRLQHTIYNSRDMAISKILQKELSADGTFVAFGNNWNSSFAYLSQKKSFTVPNWFKEYDKALKYPEQFVDNNSLEAVIFCPTGQTQSDTFIELWRNKPNWRMGSVFGCFLSFKNKPSVVLPIGSEPVNCEGNFDQVERTNILDSSSESGLNFLTILGWSTVMAEKGIVPDSIYITLKNLSNNSVSVYEALRTQREDVALYFDNELSGDSGFSLILDVSIMSGNYDVNLYRKSNNTIEKCHFNKKIAL